MGNLANTNELLGLLHGFYGIGATISPVIATSMVSTYGLQWYHFFYVMAGAVTVELVLATITFWGRTGKKFRQSEAGPHGGKGPMKTAMKNRVTWTCSLFLLAYVGSEGMSSVVFTVIMEARDHESSPSRTVSLGGWIVTFMIRVRHGAPFASGMTATGFWLGITLGRFVLGFVTPRIGERLAVAIYLALAMGLEILFWLVPQFIVSAVAVAFLGFFLGPLFPAAIVATTKLLPQRLHVSAIGFASAVGGGGAAVVPFAAGAIAQAKGVQTLQPIVLGLLGALFLLWLSLPKIPRHAHDE